MPEHFPRKTCGPAQYDCECRCCCIALNTRMNLFGHSRQSEEKDNPDRERRHQGHSGTNIDIGLPTWQGAAKEWVSGTFTRAGTLK